MNHRLIEIRKQIGKFVANFAVMEEDGKQYIFEGDVIREGLEISTYDEQGDVVPLADGEYVIKGVKVKVAEGKVIELPGKESKVEASEAQEPAQEGTPGDELKAEYESLKEKYESTLAELEAVKAELAELKNKPMAEPVPQRTNMAAVTDDEIPEGIKGTKYEKSYRVFKQH